MARLPYTPSHDPADPKAQDTTQQAGAGVFPHEPMIVNPDQGRDSSNHHADRGPVHRQDMVASQAQAPVRTRPSPGGEVPQELVSPGDPTGLRQVAMKACRPAPAQDVAAPDQVPVSASGGHKQGWVGQAQKDQLRAGQNVPGQALVRAAQVRAAQVRAQVRAAQRRAQVRAHAVADLRRTNSRIESIAALSPRPWAPP